jgi:SAM-dependent methyltransferase
VTSAMDDEFDTVAYWTGEVAADLGTEYRIPAGCRGSGSPAALSWLLGRLAVAGHDRMLDSGAGVGGPAGFAAETVGVLPILAEPESGACQAARRLFDLPIVQASGTALPFANATFDVAWCLGVLCTVADQAALLAELRRVLSPNGRLGLLVLAATTTAPIDQPEGNTFPLESSLPSMVTDAGFTITARVSSAQAPELFTEPDGWRERVATVQWKLAEQQSAKIGQLLSDGAVRTTLWALRCR